MKVGEVGGEVAEEGGRGVFVAMFGWYERALVPSKRICIVCPGVECDLTFAAVGHWGWRLCRGAESQPWIGLVGHPPTQR